MRIAILASESMSGGNNVVFEHAGNLVDRGYKVTMVVDGEVDKKKLSWHRRGSELEWISLELAKQHTYDIAIATFWRTCYKIISIPASRYLYFNQSVESRFFPDEDTLNRSFSELTYCLGFYIVTEASWIKTYIKEHYNQDAFFVPNGVNKEIFKLDGPCYASRNHGNLRVLVEGPLNIPFKNVQRTIDLCRQAGVDEVWLLTSTVATHVDGVDQLFSRVPIAETPPIYRSCDAIVKLSFIEGMFGPPLEMFHCGGTAVVYNVTGHEEYIRNGHNALVAEMGDESAVLQHLRRLREDPELLATLKAHALETARDWIDWNSSTDRFEFALQEIVEKFPLNACTVITKTRLVNTLASHASTTTQVNLEASFFKLSFRKFFILTGRFLVRKIKKRFGIY
ncbi:MAG TPA: glycosyltransferase family 4 protein [Spirochaetia bacterium]|nr:glycosyltransferase family 4 protein [Spirochaetia bacterium]